MHNTEAVNTPELIGAIGGSMIEDDASGPSHSSMPLRRSDPHEGISFSRRRISFIALSTSSGLVPS